MMQEGGFLEHAQFSGNLYGTSVATVQAAQRAGKTCLLDVEMEGVKQLKKHDSNANSAEGSKQEGWLPARYMFIAPPSFEELERRLRGRQTDKPEAIEKRLKQARLEMEFAEGEGVHDKVVVNDDLDTAYLEVEKFCLGEE
jgi:guanylate kinase